MINKIVFALFSLCMFIAIPLALAGVEHVDLGDDFLIFMNRCSLELERYKIEIPNIPMIKEVNSTNWWDTLFNGLINFVNFLTTILNVVVTLLNVIIQLFQFIFIVIRNMIDMVNSVTGVDSSSSDSIWTSAEEGSSGSYGSMSAVEGFLHLKY